MHLEPNYWKIDFGKLPSYGKQYPLGASMRFRCLNMRDLKYLSGMNANNAHDMVNDLVKRVLVLDKMELSDVLAMDRLSIIFYIRTNTFMLSNGYQTEFTCPFCGARVRSDFKMSDLHVKRITESKLGTCRVDGIDEEISSVYKKFYDPVHRTGDPEVDDILNWTNIDQIIGGNDSEMKDTVEGLLAPDYAKLRRLANDAKCGILSYADLSCTQCRKELRVGVNISDDNLFNKVRMYTMIKNQIQVSKYCGIVLTDDMPYNEVELTIGIVNELSKKEAEAMQKGKK